MLESPLEAQQQKEQQQQQQEEEEGFSGVIRERPLVWDDWGSCCFDKGGRHIGRDRAAKALLATVESAQQAHAQAQAPAVATAALPLPADWCDLEAMHDELAQHFDYITCHRHLRPDMPQ